MRRSGTISISAICALLALAPQQGKVALRVLPPEFAYEARGGGGENLDEGYRLSFLFVNGDLQAIPACVGESYEEFNWCLQGKAEACTSGRAGR